MQTTSSRVISATVFVCALIAALTVGYARGVAAGQNIAPQPPTFKPPFEPAPLVVLSGSDIGFQMDRNTISGVATGRLVVRVNGQWIEAKLSKPEE